MNNVMNRIVYACLLSNIYYHDYCEILWDRVHCFSLSRTYNGNRLVLVEAAYVAMT